ncbi:MAG: hypothetical protein ACREVN_05510 [Gammaproteobacteria bacterium]
MAISPLRAAYTLAAIALCTLPAGCVTSQIEQVRQGATGISDGEALVILARRHHSGHEAEPGFTDCITESLTNGKRSLEVRPEQAFLDSLFPWFEPRTAPLSVDTLPKLLDEPLIAEKLAETGVRYIVWVDGATETSEGAGSMTCAVGPGGGGCFGFTWWDKDSQYEAAVWDLETHEDVGRISAAAQGTSYMPAIIVPIPLLARTQATACKGLAAQLKDFLVVQQ